MSRIADEKRGGGRMSASDERLADRRAALRRAVSDLGEVTDRFRGRLAESGHEVPPASARRAAGALPNDPLRAGADGVMASVASPLSPRPPADAPSIAVSPLPPRPSAPATGTPGAGDPASSPTPAQAQHDAAMAEARQRFDAASRQAEALVRTITEAVESETKVLQANVEASAEARWREVETEARRRLRRAEAEADALVDRRRRRIAEVSDRILELGETLAGRLGDADQVKGQFDAFVRSLSEASDRLAAEGPAAPEASVSELADRGEGPPMTGLAEAA